MKPKKPANNDRQRELFRVELLQIVDQNHGLVKLSNTIDWDRLEEVFGATYCPDNGRPAISTRLMVALHYLKYTHNLSDDDVVTGWVENPYWQFFSGMKWFEHTMPIHPSSMRRWRKRIGDKGAEQLLQQTIKAGLKLKAVKPHQLKRVNVDTTVQETEIRFPTDSRLYDRARQRLVGEAKKRGIGLRQNYNRLSKQLLAQQSRYAHAKQTKRAKRCTRKLKTYLGRVIRDIERNYTQPDKQLDQLRDIGIRIYRQKRNDKNKAYSVHAPEVHASVKEKRINAMSLAVKSVLRPRARVGGL
jgi:transposase, IS5 family